MRKIAIYLLLLYQKVARYLYVSPCRFSPTCSEYAMSAIEKHGAAKGTYLAFKRLIRCNQWFEGGYDPVR